MLTNVSYRKTRGTITHAHTDHTRAFCGINNSSSLEPAPASAEARCLL